MMMELGYQTSDVESEGFVSSEVVRMRLNLDYPLVPDSLLETVVSYLNMTKHLSESASSFSRIDLENVVDVYWPVPLMGWSGLPMQPVLREFMWRFDTNQFNRKDETSQLWLGSTGEPDLNSLCAPPSATQSRPTVKVGILGGHLNNHPVGRAVLHRLMGIGSKQAAGLGMGLGPITVTLLVFPLVVSSTTAAISAAADRVVNLPSDSHQAWRLIESLHLDVLLFPDWQPFPGPSICLTFSSCVCIVE